MSNPWTTKSFPKVEAVYVRRKGHPPGASLVLSYSHSGVLVLADDGKIIGITWAELHATCERHDESLCGTRS